MSFLYTKNARQSLIACDKNLTFSFTNLKIRKETCVKCNSKLLLLIFIPNYLFKASVITISFKNLMFQVCIKYKNVSQITWEPNSLSRCSAGRFGTGVSSFFVFLKSLLFLNITTFILEFGLVTLPSVIIENNITSGANTNSCYFDELQTQNETSFMSTVTQQAADFISGKVRTGVCLSEAILFEKSNTHFKIQEVSDYKS